MPLDNEEFKFPDEVAETKGKPGNVEIEIEIEDDTPVEDRGRQPLPKPLAEELERDELDQYDDNVKTKCVFAIRLSLRAASCNRPVSLGLMTR